MERWVWGGGRGVRTFLIDPLHGEELVVVHGAHVLHLPVQTLVWDGRLKVSDHDVPAEKTNKSCFIWWLLWIHSFSLNRSPAQFHHCFIRPTANPVTCKQRCRFYISKGRTGIKSVVVISRYQMVRFKNWRRERKRQIMHLYWNQGRKKIYIYTSTTY